MVWDRLLGLKSHPAVFPKSILATVAGAWTLVSSGRPQLQCTIVIVFFLLLGLLLSFLPNLLPDPAVASSWIIIIVRAMNLLPSRNLRAEWLALLLYISVLLLPRSFLPPISRPGRNCTFCSVAILVSEILDLVSAKDFGIWLSIWYCSVSHLVSRKKSSIFFSIWSNFQFFKYFH